MRRRLLTLVAATLMATGLGYIPAVGAYATSGKCDSSGTVCEWVVNSGNFIKTVKVYNAVNGGTNTMRWLYGPKTSPQVQASHTGPQHDGWTFTVNRYLTPGYCVWGGIVNVARTYCWVVPSS